jgi:hypothetical protein
LGARLLRSTPACFEGTPRSYKKHKNWKRSLHPLSCIQSAWVKAAASAV